MSLWTRVRRFVRTIYSKGKRIQTKPSYTITVSGSPAGYSHDTTGKLVSTPGTKAQPGITSGSYRRSSGGRVTSASGITTQQAQQIEEAKRSATRSELIKTESFKKAQERVRV
ncbi:unnamed protein product, partial [marine sediment metagenome]